PLSQLPHAAERTGPPPLRDDRLRFLLPQRSHVLEPDPHRVAFERALRLAQVHVGWTYLDAATLRVPHERRRRVEAHRLRVQKRAEELTRIVMPQPRRL